MYTKGVTLTYHWSKTKNRFLLFCIHIFWKYSACAVNKCVVFLLRNMYFCFFRFVRWNIQSNLGWRWNSERESNQVFGSKNQDFTRRHIRQSLWGTAHQHVQKSEGKKGGNFLTLKSNHMSLLIFNKCR